ncbi:hypothetical protein BACPEC_00446 [[Bacteroides] pectinophilus ATCC 43243]|uniref:Uncharacterized protein n=1 Tax=[Bacteroides] pectinophilus ATCC 43243 TaxID=483218 RepID=B7AP42_9FIRM|nr:hypothetical protein BACPEC_00446 [[Bacteroides] pectinophilus ATCC 43243]
MNSYAGINCCAVINNLSSPQAKVNRKTRLITHKKKAVKRLLYINKLSTAFLFYRIYFSQV